MDRSNCPISCTLDILGDKWTLIIIRDALFKGYSTYGQFQSSPEGISSNILAARLNKLVDKGIFTKNRDKSNKLKIHYMLTDKGRSLERVVVEVASWGINHIDGTYDTGDEIEQYRSSL